jgi:coenzyme F420-reducing hydrogenase beta subunit
LILKEYQRRFDVVFDVILKNGQKANKKFNLMELFGVLQQHHRWNRCRLCTDYSAEYSDISFGGVHVTTRTSLGEDIVNRAMVDGWLKPSPPNEMFDNVAVQIDRSVAMMKKEQNRKRIADYKQKRKPVPKLE